MIQLYHGEKQATFNDMKMIYPLCIRPTQLIDIYSATSLKQQSTDRHVITLGHIILIPSLLLHA
jgi:hypothetical protein